MATARIASLHVYPVKSCLGMDLRDVRIVHTGFEWDRRWMIVDANSRFVTQRERPRLTAISAAVGGGRLRLTTEGQPPLVLDTQHDGPRRRVRIWKHEAAAIDAGDDAADWLLALMGEPMRLVRVVEGELLQADPEYAGPGANPVNFSDGYPILMISRASLEDLNPRLPAPLPMNRFRPNIVIEGLPPYAEDAMTVFRFGRVALRGVKHCTRCSITTTDQASGARDLRQEPLRTLKTYRWDRKLKGVAFGQNCTVVGGVGETLAVGAELAIDPYQV
ncbi:MAG: MOSC domain-containing protein [Gammaproteobacteria bacterium]